VTDRARTHAPRRAAVSDARGIAEVQVLSWQAAYRGLLSEATLAALSVPQRERTWHEALARGTPELLLVDGPDGDVVGWIAFGRSRDPGAAAQVAEVWALYVHPDHWSAGIGRALWHAARQRLIESGFATTTLWVLTGNPRARRFYAAAGFVAEPATEKPFELGGQTVLELRMTAPLRAPPTPGDSS
jgi:GNAT superfamily N-acetyltransferase